MKYRKTLVILWIAAPLWAGQAQALDWLGPGNEKVPLQDTVRMNQVCQDSYGATDARWASSLEYEEMVGTGNSSIRNESENFALRAPETIFTNDNRSYDQPTGTLSPAGKFLYPGAVVVKPKGMTSFSGRESKVRPLCISGARHSQLNF